MTIGQLEAFHLSLIRWHRYGSTLYKYDESLDELQLVDSTDEAVVNKLMNKTTSVNNILFKASICKI